MTENLKNIILIVLVFCSVVYYGWIGYLASDDMLYSKAAENWLNTFPYLGENHFSLRHPLVITIALNYFIFGVNEYSLTLPITVCFFIIVISTYYFFYKISNKKFALISALAIITLPLFATQATMAGCDIVELFFILSSILFFYLACNNEKSLFFIFAGLTAGFAWLTRETAIALPIFYAGLFIFGYGNRKTYYWIGAGFLSIALTELIVYYLVEGDPFYRVWIDIDQGKSTNDLAIHPGTGNVEVNRLLNPILSLVLNQEFMLLYILFIPASIWLFKEKKQNQNLYKLLILFFWLALTWFIVIGYGFGVRALPRYFSVTSYLATIIVIAWLYATFSRNKKLSILLFILYFSTNFVGMYVENKQPLYGERALYDWLINNPSKEIYTDPKTYWSAFFLLKTANIEHRAHPEKPGNKVTYYFFNPNRVFQDTRKIGYAETYKPLKKWNKIETVKPKRKWSGVILEWLGLDKFLPKHIVKRLNHPVSNITIYRTF